MCSPALILDCDAGSDQIGGAQCDGSHETGSPYFLLSELMQAHSSDWHAPAITPSRLEDDLRSSIFEALHVLLQYLYTHVNA